MIPPPATRLVVAWTLIGFILGFAVAIAWRASL